MIDRDLAELYQVRAIALRQQVKRNIRRFPPDFLFQLTPAEAKFLVSQNVIPSAQSLGGSLPYAFTEHGVAMLSAVLKSKRAVKMSIFIIRAFIQLHKMIIEHKEISNRLQKAEKVIKFHDQVLFAVVEDVKKLKNPPKINLIGFQWRPK